MTDERTHVDLFSGIGGFSLACEWAGVKTIAFAEIDNYASKVLKRHWPDVPNYGNVRNVPAIDDVWLVTGGVPCQPASVAGKRRGTADDRWLWPQALAAVERIKPTWVLFENPTGILSLNDGVEFERICAALEGQGYEVQPLIIPACAVGAPHRRNRVWIVAHSHGTNVWQQGGEFCEAERRPWRALSSIVSESSKDVAHSAGADARSGGGKLESQKPAYREQTQLLFDTGSGSGTPTTGNNNEDVSDSEVGTERAGLCEGKQGTFGRRRSGDVCSKGNVSDTESERLEGDECEELAQSRAGRLDPNLTGSDWRGIESELGERADGLSPGLGGSGVDMWADGTWEQGIDRLAAGVANRVGKLRCLGNAIVPQIAFQLIKRMIEAEQC